MPVLASPSSRTRVHDRVVVPLIVGMGMMLALAHVTPGMRSLLRDADRQMLDRYHRWGEKTAAREDLVVLGIDDASLTVASAWPEDIEGSAALQAMRQPFPWPRRVWAEAIDRLCESGARLIFLDLAFVAPAADPEDDARLRAALERHKGKVLLGGKFDRSRVGAASLSNLVYPSPTLTGAGEQEKVHVGLLNFWPDADQIVRMCDLEVTRSQIDGGVRDAGEQPLPSIALAAARILEGEVFEVPASVRPRFCGLEAYPPNSLHTIFVPDLWEANFGGGSFFKGKTVFIGATAAEMQDFQRIPLGTLTGVQLHAHALTAVLSKSFLREAGAGWRWGSVLAGLGMAWLLIHGVRQPVLTLAAFGLGSGLVAAVTYWFFNRWNVELSPVPFTLALSLGGAAGLTGNALGQIREQRKLQRFLARYTSPEFAHEMLQDREGLFTTLGGVERQVTILFSDVRGFTSMSENMSPAEIVGQLNEYLSRMVEQVFRQRGLVDKFIGDAVMALWGSTRFEQGEPGDREDACNAVVAALGMRVALRELNEGWKAREIPELAFGIGIHQGLAVVGNIGSEAPYEKMDLTVIGDSVNLASRLESITKQYGVDIAISEAVYRHIEADFLCRSADLVRVKGKLRPVKVFTVLGRKGETLPEGLAVFESAVRDYREGRFGKARDGFMEARKRGLDDTLTEVYVKRCEALLEDAPEGWDGVFTMTGK